MKKILLLITLCIVTIVLHAQQSGNKISDPLNPFNRPSEEVDRIHRDFFSLKTEGKPSPIVFQNYIKQIINRELKMYKGTYPMINPSNYINYAYSFEDEMLIEFSNRIAEEIYNYLTDNRIYAKQGSGI